MTVTKLENWESFFERINDFSEQDKWIVDYAYHLAKSAHRTQQRDDGERYFEHPRSSAIIILDEFKLRIPHLIIGALLHDVGEDSSIFGNQMKLGYSQWIKQVKFILTKSFNSQVAEIVLALTRPQVDGKEIISKEQAEKIAISNLTKACSEAKIVKMADRLHNLRTINGLADQSKRIKKIHETTQYYFPIFELAGKDYPWIVSYAIEQMNLAIETIVTI